MPSPGLRATVAVVVLVLLGVTTGALAAFELSQPTSTSTTTSTNYSASLTSSLNVSLRSNPLSPATNVTNPSAIFANVTKSLGLSFWFRFVASQPLAVAGVLACDARFYSGTTPGWSMPVFAVSRPLFFDAAAASAWFTPAVNLSSIASVLNESSAINNEFGLAPAAGTLVFNASFVIDLPEGVVAQNNSSVQFSFVYSSGGTGSSSPSAYSAINAVYAAPGGATGGWTATDSNPLPSYSGLGEAFLAVAIGAFVAAAIIGALYIPRKRPSPLERFLSENGENVVRVAADTRVGRHSVRVKDLAELVKLSNLSGQPIFLFESATQGALLYVVEGETSFAYVLSTSTPPQGIAS